MSRKGLEQRHRTTNWHRKRETHGLIYTREKRGTGEPNQGNQKGKEKNNDKKCKVR